LRRSQGVRWWVCWCGHDGWRVMSIDSDGRPAAAAAPQHGAQQHSIQQQMRAVSSLQPT